ncbi:MAG TPA: TPM domain-containing protein [Pyrinomonadaceae bacterium]|jgi:uncharacterized membrane protein YgcG
MRLDVRNSAPLCAAALLLAALAQGCLRSSPPANGGGAPPPAQAARDTNAQPPPAQAAHPAASASPAAESLLPPPKGLVNDFAAVFDDRTRGALEARLRLLQERARVEFAVVTVETTGGRDIKDYSLAVARGWGVGPPAGEEGGGLLLMLAIKDRRWWMQVGRSLEADIPDDAARQAGEGMVPLMREGRYGDAVARFVDEIIGRLEERRGFSMKDAR